MCYWSRTPQESFRTTPFSSFLCPISHTIPPFFQHPSHMTFHHRGLPHFQILPTGTLQVTFPQPFHIHFLQIYCLGRISQIHPLLPVNIKVTSPLYLHSHPQGCYLSHPLNIHLIILALILLHPHFFFCLKLQVWYPEIHHQICLVYLQPQLLLNYP